MNRHACERSGHHKRGLGAVVRIVQSDHRSLLGALGVFILERRKRGIMNTTHSSSLGAEVPAYAQLQCKMHDALAQHPDWILPNGDCPTCDSYDARYSRSCSSKRCQRGLADRSNAILTNLNTNSNILPASPRRITYNEKDENSCRWWRVCRSLCRQLPEQEVGAQAGHRSDADQPRKFYSLHADAARGRRGRSFTERHRKSAPEN